MPGEVGEVTQPGGLGPRPGPQSGGTPPTVDAGGPYLGPVGVATALNATVTPGSDGSPTLLWEIVSGGTGSFSSTSVEDPTFTPDNGGGYVLRLTVTPSDVSPVIDTATFAAGSGRIWFNRRRRRR